MHSRGLESGTVSLGQESTDNDPITRAVRIVHEQLRDSTESRIDAVQAEFEQKLFEKDQGSVKASVR